MFAIKRCTMRISNKFYDEAIKVAKDSIVKKENGYTLGVNSQGTIYLAFPGETESNPHMYLGKNNSENMKKAEEMFNKFKGLRKAKDAKYTGKTWNEFISNVESQS